MGQIELRAVDRIFRIGDTRVHALKAISLSIEAGEYLTVMGPSGSGKSTLMNILGCLDLPDSGRYLLQGHDVTQLHADQLAALRNREIGFVFQNFNLLPRTSALENVETPLVYAGIGHAERTRRATEMLRQMGLEDRLASLPSQLSGGQQQRVAIARALVTRPALLLADEPTGNLDTATSAEIISLLEKLNRDEGVTVVLITHEPEVAERARRTLVVRDGRLQEERG